MEKPSLDVALQLMMSFKFPEGVILHYVAGLQSRVETAAVLHIAL